MGQYPVKVSVGLPVYNGEKYGAQAIDSVLNQTFTDLELIVSDNASTDSTLQLLEEYADRDPRVRLYMQPQNIGGGPNFNFVLERARGKYFQWIAHDDLWEPSFLEHCVAKLEEDPTASLCYSDAKIIDADNRFVEVHHIEVDTLDPSPITRFRNLMLSRNHRCYEIFGLIRTKILDETLWMGNYAVADRILLAQLALRGPFKALGEPLFINRRHPEQFSLRMRNQREATIWFDPRKTDRIIYPEWKAFNEYRISLCRAPLTRWEKVKGHFYLLQYLRMYRHRMGHDLVHAVKSWWKRIWRKS